MRVNSLRLRTSLLELGEIGFEVGVGTSRMAYSKEFNMGRDYVKFCMEQAGLKVSVDPVGNLTGLLPGRECGKPIISMGLILTQFLAVVCMTALWALWLPLRLFAF